MNIYNKILPLSGILVLLNACSVGAPYTEPKISTPETFVNGSQEGIEKSTAPQNQWWLKFRDEQLNTLVRDAINNNFNLKVARGNLVQARELLIEARYNYFPTVTSEADYSREHIAKNGLLGGSANRNLNLYSAGFDASWELDIFGRVSYGVEAKNAELGAFEADFDDTQLSIVAEVARNYMQLRGLQSQVEVAIKNSKNQKESFQLTEKIQRGGTGTDLDVSRAQSQYEDTLSSIPDLQGQIDQVCYRLSVLTGKPPGTLVSELSLVRPLPVLVESIQIGEPSFLIENRPDVRAAERALAASVAQVGIRTADLYPRITIVGNGGLDTLNFGKILESDSGTFSIGPSISWPAFNLGRVRALLRATEAASDAKLNVFQQTVLNALEDVDVSLTRYKRENEKLKHLLRSQTASAKASRLARKQFQDGLIDFLSVLDSERRERQVDAEVAQSKTQIAINLIAIFKALGFKNAQ